MDRLFIHNLTVETIIGIKPAERQQRQPLLIDLDLAVNTQQAALTDDMPDAVDYESLTQQVIQFIQQSQFFLIETLANKLAEFIQQQFKIKGLQIRICKPKALKETAQVGVIIKRGDI